MTILNQGRIKTDPATIAYLALGAKASRYFDEAVDRYGVGEDGLIEWVISFANALDTLYEQPHIKSAWRGHWAFDVPECLGTWMIDHFEITQDTSPSDIDGPVLKKARHLVNQHLDASRAK